MDRQLRGRCARQGDPALTQVLHQLRRRSHAQLRRGRSHDEDHGDASAWKEGQELEHPWLNKCVETAQKRVEQRDYMRRRRTRWNIDDVMNQQREVVYGYRQEVMDSERIRACSSTKSSGEGYAQEGGTSTCDGRAKANPPITPGCSTGSIPPSRSAFPREKAALETRNGRGDQHSWLVERD